MKKEEIIDVSSYISYRIDAILKKHSHWFLFVWCIYVFRNCRNNITREHYLIYNYLYVASYFHVLLWIDTPSWLKYPNLSQSMFGKININVYKKILKEKMVQVDADHSLVSLVWHIVAWTRSRHFNGDIIIVLKSFTKKPKPIHIDSLFIPIF